MKTKLARAAQWYGRIGWNVFPLRPHTKEPFFGIGVYQATTDTKQIAQWWHRWPNANVGLHCGGSGLLALDLDAYKDNFEGDKFLSHEDEETITNLTGNGGTHLVFAVPADTKYGNATGTLPYGIDVRGWGGYIVLPPSIHPNGNAYHWEDGYGPHEVKPAALPNRLREILDGARMHYRAPGRPDALAVQIAEKIVDSVIANLGLEHYGEQVYDSDGRKWILRYCPFNPPTNPHANDKAAYIIVARDGHISAGCQHARCNEVLKSAKLSGWKLLVRQTEAVHV